MPSASRSHSEDATLAYHTSWGKATETFHGGLIKTRWSRRLTYTMRDPTFLFSTSAGWRNRRCVWRQRRPWPLRKAELPRCTFGGRGSA